MRPKLEFFLKNTKYAEIMMLEFFSSVGPIGKKGGKKGKRGRKKGRGRGRKRGRGGGFGGI